MSRSPNRHVALRVPYPVTVGGETVDVLEEHNRIARSRGSVALGKFGRSPSFARLAPLEEQIEVGTPTSLVAIVRRDRVYKAFAAPLREVRRGGSAPDKSIVPVYYGTLEEHPSVWFVLGGPLTPTRLEDLRMTQTGRPLSDVLGECRTALMFVCGKVYCAEARGK